MKETPKTILNKRIKEWKNEQANKEVIKQINPDFVDNYFKTLLVNYPNDSTWIHNLPFDKFSEISTAAWPIINSGSMKYNEIISINLISEDDEDSNWVDEETKKQYDIANIVIDCSHCATADELTEISEKYFSLADKLSIKYFRGIKDDFGPDFLNNLFVALKDNLEADDKILRINLSFINISDENIDLDNYKSIIEARGGDLSDNDMELRNNVTAHFYNNETLLSLYDQCLNCQYPYVNAVETIKLTSDGVCKYRVPDEDLTGYLCNISAKSLAKLYQRYRNGLFSGNIRFFIKKGKGAKNVNIGIKESIRDKKKRGMFYFLNNGITFITPSVKFSKGSIEMDKFSIVNGGQTTYLIGTEPFDEDFSIPCKILEIKCDVSRKLQLKNEEKYKTNLTTWLSHARDISYALNSQKPVADKDLVTNRVSVKRLKEYYNRESNGNVIFLTKAGEDSFLPSEQKSKAIKLETYLTLVYCLFLQLPGFAKNQKQKMYAKTNIEKVLGLDEDRDSKKFLSPAQLIQANQMKKQIDKIINKIGRDLKKNPDQFKLDDTIKIGVLKYSKNIVLSLCGLAHMWSLNNDLFNSYSHHQYFQDEFRKKHSDYIDLTKPIFKKESISSSQAVEEAIWDVLDYVIYPAYKKWKSYEERQGRTETSYRMFSMKDETYFNYVVGEFSNLHQKSLKDWMKIFIDLVELN